MTSTTSPVSIPSATRPLQVVLVNATRGAKGGVTIDVENIARGLVSHGHNPVVATSMSALAKGIRGRQRTLIHVFGCLPALMEWIAMAEAKGARRRLVWTPIFHPNRQGSWKEREQDWKMAIPFRVMRIFDSVMPYAARFADAVIAATEDEATFFRRIGARRVEVIPPGVPALGSRGTRRDAARFRSAFGLSEGPVVLMVARDSRPKGMNFGLATFNSLKMLMPGAQLLVLGSPADHPGARQDGVRFGGWVGPTEIELAYANASLLFVPSLYEGLPRVVVEAWAFGLPVVATDRIALAPQVEGVTGLTIPYKDIEAGARALASIISNPGDAARFGTEARRLVGQGFLLDQVVTRTIDLYEDLVEHDG